MAESDTDVAKSPLRLAICGGGSGGHLTPAMAIVDELERVECLQHVLFLTSSRDVDRRVLSGRPPSERWSVEPLPIVGRGKLKTFLQLPRSICRAFRALRNLRPHVVIGTGGFASVPGVLAAFALGVPVLLLECNTVPGRVNRWFQRGAALTFTGWPLCDDFRKRWRSEIVDSGIPLRAAFTAPALNRDSELIQTAESDPATVLILGGSQGAASLNRLVIRAFLPLLKTGASRERDLRIVHQTGPAGRVVIDESWHRLSSVQVVDFVDDVHEQFRRATIVISRAGAVTLAELAASGVPGILIPLPESADQHQAKNASLFEGAGAAVVVGQSAGDSVEALRSSLNDILTDSAVRQRMQNAMAHLAKLDAVSQIVRRILQYGDAISESGS